MINLIFRKILKGGNNKMEKKLFMIGILMMIALLLSSTAVMAATSGTVYISGNVVNSAKVALSGVTVKLTQGAWDFGTKTTSNTGKYAYTVVSAKTGWYCISASKLGYKTTQRCEYATVVPGKTISKVFPDIYMLK